MSLSITSPLPSAAPEPGNNLAPLDLALAEWLAGRDPEHARVLRAVSFLLSAALRDGHTAIRLSDIDSIDSGATIDALSDAGLSFPILESIQASLVESRLVGKPGDSTPLILDDDLLAFRRFHEGERRIMEAVRHRIGRVDEHIDHDRITPLFRQLFASGSGSDVDWQAVAAAAALRSRFLCIAGGPGTGKTTTVIRLMALLLRIDPEQRIKLAAPTGKAANRMAESIAGQLTRLDVDDELKARIPTAAATLHRLLGYRPSRATFRYGNRQKLPADVVIIDEASMIDHELFTSLLRALDDDARLILIGDPDQLPSVDAGFVFGDLCGMGKGVGMSPEFVDFLKQFGMEALPEVDASATAGRDAVITLHKGYRFGSESGIGLLAYALRDGDPERVASALESGYADLHVVAHDEQKRTLRRAVRELARTLVGADSPETALRELDRLRVLSPHRVGPRGVEALNEDLDLWLVDEGVRPWGSEYQGKPILITSNDYDVMLFNGDVGVLWKKGDRYVGCFPGAEGIREVPIGRLPAHEVAWAMTVHKSQGSEFDDVILVLPDEENAEHLTRELLYTAVTRAKKHVTIVGDVDVLAESATRREERVTGLGEK